MGDVERTVRSMPVGPVIGGCRKIGSLLGGGVTVRGCRAGCCIRRPERVPKAGTKRAHGVPGGAAVALAGHVADVG